MKILLFDFDGTLADSFDSFLEVTDALSLKYKFTPLSHDERETFRSEEPRKIMKRLKIPLWKIPFIARDMKKMQLEKISSVTPFTGLPKVLHALKKNGHELGIITSNGRKNVERFTKTNGIDIFSYIYSDSSMFGKDKVIHKFLKEHTVIKENVIYIGDEIRDIQACKKVGIKIIAVTWGFNSKDGLLKYHPDFLADTPEQLMHILNRDREMIRHK